MEGSKSGLGAVFTAFAWLFIFVATLIPVTITVQERGSISVWWLKASFWSIPIGTDGGDDAILLGKGKMARRQKKHELLLRKLRSSDWALKQRARANLFRELAGPAFCNQGRNSSKSNFPLGAASPPEDLVPWVFDAALSEGGELVSVVLANREVCGFDAAAWEGWLRLQPNFSSSTYRLLVPVDSRKPPRDGSLIDARLLCRFYDHKSTPLRTVESMKIAATTLQGPGSLLVRCPVPPELRARGRKLSLRLQRIASAGSGGLGSVLLGGASEEDERRAQQLMPSTKVFPICPLPGQSLPHSPHHQSAAASSAGAAAGAAVGARGGRGEGGDGAEEESAESLSQRRAKAAAAVVESLRVNENYAYNISACVSVSAHLGLGSGGAGQRKEIIEWIEYHRLLGVDHFFIVDVSGSEERARRPKVSPTSAGAGSGRGKEEEDDDDGDDDEEDASTGSRLRSLLSAYLDLGLVTIMDWPWAHCALGATCPHAVKVPAPAAPVPVPVPAAAAAAGAGVGVGGGSARRELFSSSSLQPPRRLDVARSVCYSRFRQATRWMAVLSDDEFLGVDPAKRLDGERVRDLRGLVEIADRGWSRLAAIRFRRFAYSNCPSSASSASSASSSSAASPASGNATDGAALAPKAHLSARARAEDEEAGSQPPRLSTHQHCVGELLSPRAQGDRHHANAGSASASSAEARGGGSLAFTSAALYKTSVVVSADFDAGEPLLVETRGLGGARADLAHRIAGGVGALLGRGSSGGSSGSSRERNGRGASRILLGLRGNASASSSASASASSSSSASSSASAAAAGAAAALHSHRVAARPSARGHREASDGEYTVAELDPALARSLVLLPLPSSSPSASPLSSGAAAEAEAVAGAGAAAVCKRELVTDLTEGQGQGQAKRYYKPRERAAASNSQSSSSSSAEGVCASAKEHKQFFSPWLDVLGDRFTRAARGLVAQNEGEGEGDEAEDLFGEGVISI